MNVFELASCYRLIGELFLYPAERQATQINAELEILKQCPSSVRDPITAFLSDPGSSSLDEYVRTLELDPPCPLYLGTYLFGEPKSCRGAGMSGRNNYMIELAGIYKHFSVELTGREMADFLPVMLDFLSISLDRAERDQIGLRRYFVENFLLTGLEPMLKALNKFESPYALLIDSLQAALQEDMALVADQPIWTPPLTEDLKPPTAVATN